MPEDKLPSNQPPSGKRVAAIGVVFVAVVGVIALFRDTLVLPLFLGLITWGKAILKQLTLKMAFMLAKNSLFIQIRRLVVQAFSHVLIKSHKPFRRRVSSIQLSVKDALFAVFSRYMNSPLWLRTAIALGLLALTAGSSAAILALLIIPEPLLNWLKGRLKALSNKFGVTQLFRGIWSRLVPQGWQHKWHMYVKWTLGRRQVRAAQHLHRRINESRSALAEPLEPTDCTEPSNKPTAKSTNERSR